MDQLIKRPCPAIHVQRFSRGQHTYHGVERITIRCVVLRAHLYLQYLDGTAELEAEPNADTLARHRRTVAASAETLDGLSDDTNYFQHYRPRPPGAVKRP